VRLSCSTLHHTHRPIEEALYRIRAHGFTGWELPFRADGVHLGHIDPDRLEADPDLARRFLAAQAVCGLPCTGGGFECARSRPLDRELAVFLPACRLLAELGAPSVTVFLFDDGVAPTAIRLPALRAVARSHGLDILVETHLHTATQDPARALALCREYDLRLNADPSHYLFQGIAPQEFAALAPWIAAVQIRGAAPGLIEAPVDAPAARDLIASLLPCLPRHPVLWCVEYIDRQTDWEPSVAALRQALRSLIDSDSTAARAAMPTGSPPTSPSC
jgi:sugar phosphate isomerase/epimerase